MIFKTIKKGTRPGCSNWRSVYVLLVVTKILVKIILKRIREHLESLIDRVQASFRPESFYTDISKFRVIVEQCA